MGAYLSRLSLYSGYQQLGKALYAPIKRWTAKQIPDAFERSAEKVIDLKATGLFDGFTAHPIDLEKLQTDQLVVVHCTDFLDTTSGKIPSPKDSGYYPRSTVHTSLNHAVGDLLAGATTWKQKPYIILEPLDSVIKQNGKPIGFLEADTYWGKSLDINNKHTIILVQQKHLPQALKTKLGEIREGSAKVINPADLGFDPHVQFKILAVQEPHKEAENVIQKMGYTAMPAGSVTWGHNLIWDVKESYSFTPTQIAQRKAIKELCRREGLPEMLHTLSVPGQFEKSLFMIKILQIFDDTWIKQDHDYKSEVLSKLKSIESELLEAEQDKIQSPFSKNDNNQLQMIRGCIHLIKNAEQPSEAVSGISKLLQVEDLCEKKVIQQQQAMINKFNGLINTVWLAPIRWLCGKSSMQNAIDEVKKFLLLPYETQLGFRGQAKPFPKNWLLGKEVRQKPDIAEFESA